MKTIIWILLFSLFAQVAFPQSKGSFRRTNNDSFERKQESSAKVKTIQNKGSNDYILELFPGQLFIGWCYCWSNGGSLTGNYKVNPEVGWLSVKPNKFTSTGCADIIPLKYSFVAPMKEGVYITNLIDSTGNWGTQRIELRVTKSPKDNIITRKIGINQNSISYKSYLWNYPFNWDNSCIIDYYPSDSLEYNYTINPAINWLTISPSSGKIFRNGRQDLQITIKKKLFDSTWVTHECKYYAYPTFYHYYVKETEPKEYSLQFTGENTVSTDYYPSSSTKTLMYWVRFDSIADQAIGVNDGENHRFYLGILKNNTLFAGMGNYYTPLTSLNLIPGKWYHMALSANNDSAVVYINGTEVSRWKYSFSGESKAELYIGARNDYSAYGNYIKGLIDEVQVWERPLSRTEIINYMFNPPMGNENGLVLYYPFNEGWGNFTKNTVDNYYFGIIYNESGWNDSIIHPSDPSQTIYYTTRLISISKDKLIAGDTIKAEYLVNRKFENDNQFSLQLSDANGNFTNPVTIGSVESDTNGVIIGKIPINLPEGCSYNLRIVASNPVITGNVYSKTMQIADMMNFTKDYAIKLDGYDDYVDLGTWFNQKSFTVSFWVNPDSIQKQGATIISLQYDLALYNNPLLNNNYVLLHLLQFDLLPRKWQHITITMDGNTNKRKVYLFGHLIQENTWTYTPRSGYHFLLGRGNQYYTGVYWKGMIDELKIWNSVLSDEDILTNVNKQLKGSENGLLAYYGFNETCSDIIKDNSSNVRNGTAYNGVLKVFTTVPNVNQSIYPDKGGNTGNVSVTIQGYSFQSNVIVKLTSASKPEIIADTSVVRKEGTELICQFNLIAKDPGLYNIEIIRPDSTIEKYPNSFTIEEGMQPDKPDIWLDVIGRSFYRRGTYQTFVVNYGNNSNIDVYNTFLWIAVKGNSKMQFKVENEYFIKQIESDSLLSKSDSIPQFFPVDSLFDKPFNGFVLPIFVPIMSAGSNHSFAIKVFNPTNENFEIITWKNDTYGISVSKGVSSTDLQDCIYNVGTFAMDKVLAPIISNYSGIPEDVIACWSGTAQWGYSAGVYLSSEDQGLEESLNLGLSFLTSMLPCLDLAAQIIIPEYKPVRAGLKIVYEIISDVNSLKEIGTSCYKAMTDDEQKTDEVKSVNSYDPNEKVGPRLIEPFNYSKGEDDFAYAIYFENKASATAPAQEVSIVDTLDINSLDISSFSYSIIGFGDTTINATNKYQTSFVKDIDLRPSKNLIVRLSAKLDILTGIAVWKFVSLDPQTMQLTEDPLLGFLPPNIQSPQGEGFVSYIVKPKRDLLSDTKIRNTATIVFDMNEPIQTNHWINTIDKIKPKSMIQPIANPIDTLFEINWTGEDIGSGVRDYTIFVSENDGAYFPWLTNTKNISSIFKAKNNTSYNFYSIARDNVLNIEEKTILPDARVTVQISQTSIEKEVFSDMTIYPNPTNDILTIKDIPIPSRLNIYDIQGKLIINIQLNSTTETINVANLAVGIYTVKISNIDGSYLRKLIIER